MHCIERIGESRGIFDTLEVADVEKIRPDLTESQAWEALKLAQAHTGPGAGITFDAIDRAADFLYGWPPRAVEAQGGCHGQ
jgi:hypothetical protein